MRMRHSAAWMTLWAVILVVATLPETGRAATPEETVLCLQCHANKGIIKRFENGESVDASLDAERFRTSVHAFLKCSHCHTEFSAEHHPERIYKSALHYRQRNTHVCRRCHTDDQLEMKSVHASILHRTGEMTPLCTNCHDAHYARRRPDAGSFTSEEHYCLRCHGKETAMTLLNGERISLLVDAAALGASVHDRISCSDCHFGFTTDEHPQRSFRSRRDFIIALSESCRRCHFDKYTRTMESIHYTMLSRGNLKAPVCTDCHGAHGVPHVIREKTSIAKRCRQCHPDIYAVYAESVHGSALFTEHNQDVPVCIDCHTAHDIQNPFSLDYRQTIPDLCSRCHADPALASRYGLSHRVVDTYISDFHGVTLKLYRLQSEELSRPAKPIAVCTDCHGTHDIRSTVDPGAATVRTNLEQRCRKCHEEAPVNFPASWLPHYEASLAKAPLVFVVKAAFTVVTPLILAGLVLQIVLHIWRYAVNR